MITKLMENASQSSEKIFYTYFKVVASNWATSCNDARYFGKDEKIVEKIVWASKSLKWIIIFEKILKLEFFKQRKYGGFG